jgi:hypothetical protein
MSKQAQERQSQRHRKGKFAIPVNQATRATFEALFHGSGLSPQWEADEQWRPQFRQEGSTITVHFTGRPNIEESAAALWHGVYNFNTESADVLTFILKEIANLKDPYRPVAIWFEDIAKARGVKARHGSVHVLRADLKDKVEALAGLGVCMEWKDRGGPHSRRRVFGTPACPARLFYLTGIEYEEDGHTWKGYVVQAGGVLAHFLRHGVLRWIGYFTPALLGLDPYREALVKKLGWYWIDRGTVAGMKKKLASATPRTILKTIGEKPDSDRPGRFVSRFMEAHAKLVAIGLLAEITGLEKPRGKGMLDKWLDTAITARLKVVSIFLCELFKEGQIQAYLAHWVGPPVQFHF